MKLGIAGSGKIVQEALPILQKLQVPLQGIWSRPHSADHLKSLAATYHIKQCYTDYETMLQDETIDTIYVATPNAQHYAFAKQALEHGKHVICEKAFTSNYKEATALFTLAEKQGLILLEAITNQYQPLYREIKALCDAQKLGRLRTVSLNFSQYSSRYDAFREGNILPAFDPAHAGGALMDINIYNLHFAVGLFGRPHAVHYHANIEHGIDTSGILTLTYPDFICTCIGAKDCVGQYYGELQGCEGCLSLTSVPSTCEGYRLFERKNRTTQVIEAPKQHHMLAEFQEFIRILREKDEASIAHAKQQTLLVMELVDMAKKDAGIHFPADV